MNPRKTQQDEFKEIADLHARIDTLTVQLETSIKKIEGKHRTELKQDELEQKHMDLSNELADAYNKLKKALITYSESTQKAYEKANKKGIFEQSASLSNRLDALNAEISKQPIPARLPPSFSKPAKTQSAPPVKLSDEESAFRKGFLAIKQLVQGPYYQFYDFDSINTFLNKTYDDLTENYKKYGTENALRTEVCEKLNSIIGDHKPSTGMIKSKDARKAEEKYTKIAMCIQQLGGTVANQAYNDLANKAFQKKLPAEAFYDYTRGRSAPKLADAPKKSYSNE